MEFELTEIINPVYGLCKLSVSTFDIFCPILSYMESKKAVKKNWGKYKFFLTNEVSK